MHSFLVVGINQDLVDKKVGEILKNRRLKTLEFYLEKISDVRELNTFTRLKINQPTAIIIKNIDQATVETLNAFLKNLEEPQQNIFYILTCSSIHYLLPTIVSRCQVIKIAGEEKNIDLKNLRSFAIMSTEEKLEYVSKIGQRDKACNFINEIIVGCHSQLHKTKKDHERLIQVITYAEKTYNALQINGNVNLQLTNFVLSLT